MNIKTLVKDYAAKVHGLIIYTEDNDGNYYREFENIDYTNLIGYPDDLVPEQYLNHKVQTYFIDDNIFYIEIKS